MADKPHLNLIFIGHVDHGKSTMVGRILYNTGAIDENTMRKLKEEAEKLGKATFEYAFVMDNLKEERVRGLTIDLAHREFKTDKYYFTIIDAPGHRDFVKNMITGASQADAAVLVVDCANGVQAQTKEHIFLARTLGIKQLIVAINKMDSVKYDESKYKEVKNQVATLLKTIGYKPEEILMVPTSAYDNCNVTKRDTDKCAWYSGPCLLEALNTIKLPEKPLTKPLRVPIQDVYTITGIGTVPVGRVETGVMKVGQRVVVMPSGAQGEVKSIEMHHEQMQKAEPGDNIGFNIRGIEKNDIKRGYVLGPAENPPTVVSEFTAQIVVLQHPSVLTAGYTPVFHCHTAQMACTITEITKKIDPKTGQVAQEKPDFIKTGDVAVVKVKPSRPIVLEKSSEIPEMGRFAIRDMGMTVAAGMVLDVVKKT